MRCYPNSVSRGLWWSLLALLLTRLISLGLYPLTETTEARYAEIGRKMVELGDWITPWYDYAVPFWGKPPLYAWMTAGSMKWLGVNEFAARLPHYIAGLLILWLVWDWMRRSSPRQAWLSIALLSGAALFFVSSGAVMTDMALALGLVLVMRGFWMGLYGDAHVRSREGWLMFVGLAVGLLAKGPVALVLAGVPITVWALLSRRLDDVWRGLPWMRGTLLMLALSLPWYIIAELKTPGFLHYFIIGEHWDRFIVPGWQGDRYGSAHSFPRGSIWWFALEACLPWSVLLPWLVIGRKRTGVALSGSLQGYLWAWALTPCVFFTAAGNVLWTYVLPALPPLALLAAGWLFSDTRTLRVERTMTAGLLTILVLGAGIVGAQHSTLARRTAKPVVTAYQQLNHGQAPLIFFGSRPYSAQFYSAGKVQWADSKVSLCRQLASSSAMVAWPIDDDLPVALQNTASDLGQYGRYRLARVGKAGCIARDTKQEAVDR